MLFKCNIYFNKFNVKTLEIGIIREKVYANAEQLCK